MGTIQASNDQIDLRSYAQPRLTRSLVDLATSVVPYLALSLAMLLALRVSVLLTLALALPTAAFLLRTYIVFHDCAHGSFLPTKRGNLWLGRALGLVVYTPYANWRHSHAVHHATAGDLERRGTGDLPTMTVEEFSTAGRGKRIGYRLFRNPIVMFGVGPLWALVIQPRLISRDARTRLRNSVHLTNLALLVIVATICAVVGWQHYLLVEGPPVMLAGAAGVWLFYVQHQFEDTYWEVPPEWRFAEAALRGSSYLRLPQPARFFTGNIGLHHVHHLSARIPNYNLQRAHDENPVFHAVPQLSFWDGIRATRLKLWDPGRGRMVTFSEAQTAH